MYQSMIAETLSQTDREPFAQLGCPIINDFREEVMMEIAGLCIDI